MAVQTRSSWDPQLHITWPVVKNCPGLDAALTAEANGEADEFTQAMGATSPTIQAAPSNEANPPTGMLQGNDQAVAKPAFTGNWTVVASSPTVRGIRLVNSEFGGASSSITSKTFYGPVGGTAVWKGQDLVTPQGLQVLVRLAADAAKQERWPVMADANLPEVLTDITFDSSEAMTAVLAPGEFFGADKGLVALTVAPTTAAPLLSAAGRQVRDAVAGEPHPSPDTPTTPTPSPIPATMPPAPSAARVDCREAKCLALTFDDGPGPYTDRVLDTLARHHARATFFVLGPQVEADPEVVHRAHSMGMAIGNHSWTHADLARLSDDAVVREFSRTSEAVASATGEAPVAARPPYGAFRKKTPHAGLPFVLWDVDTEDWKNRDAATTTQRAVSGAHRGAIILMHDIHSSTLQALPHIISQLQAEGYTLVTIPELIGPMSPAKTYLSAPHH